MSSIATLFFDGIELAIMGLWIVLEASGHSFLYINIFIMDV